MNPQVLVIVSIDTEGDDWQPCRDVVTVENIRALPRLDALFRRLGVRATYFTAYHVAIRDWAAATVRALQAGGAEIAAHLHPWNTPPLDEPFVPRNSMLCNLPPALQRAKLERLTAALVEGIGHRPRAFRAGRYALGPETVAALISCGYEIDSSVTPFVSWEDTDDGPNFVGAPVHPYRLGGAGDVRVPEPGGALLEMPMSIGYNRVPFGFWDRVRGTLTSRPLKALRLAGFAHGTGLLRRIFLSPERESVADMVALSHCLIAHGARQLHMFFHSPSLTPGLTPYSPDAAGAEALYRRIASYVDTLSRTVLLRFVTVSEAAAELRRAAAEVPLQEAQRLSAF